MVNPLGPAVARTLDAVSTSASTPIAMRSIGSTITRSLQSPPEDMATSTSSTPATQVLATVVQLVVRPV